MSSHKPYGPHGGGNSGRQFSGSRQQQATSNSPTPPKVGEVDAVAAAASSMPSGAAAEPVPQSPQIDEEDPSQVKARNLMKLATSGMLTNIHVDFGPSKQVEQMRDLVQVVDKLTHSRRAGEALTSVLQFQLLGGAGEEGATVQAALELLTKTVSAISQTKESWDASGILSLALEVLQQFHVSKCCEDPQLFRLCEAIIKVSQIRKSPSVERQIEKLTKEIARRIEVFSKSELGSKLVLLLLSELRNESVRRRVEQKFILLASHPIGAKVIFGFLELTGSISSSLSLVLLQTGRQVKIEADEKMLQIDDRLPSPYITMAIESDLGCDVALRIVELSNAYFRLTLTFLIEKFRDTLRSTHGRRLLEWAEGKPSLRNAMPVRDASSGLDFVVNVAAVTPTRGFQRWQSEWPKMKLLPTTPSLCLENESCNCHQQGECDSIHLLPGTFDGLRPKGKRTCCWEHDGMLNYPELKRYREANYKVCLDDGTDTVVSALNPFELSISAGLVLAMPSSHSTAYFYVSDLCKVHRHGRCEKPEQCKYIHVCKSAFDRITAAALARQGSGNGSGDGGDAALPMSPVGGDSTYSGFTPHDDVTPNVVRTYRAASRRLNKTPSIAGSYNAEGGETESLNNGESGGCFEGDGGSNRPFRVVREMLPSSNYADGYGFGRTSAYGDPAYAGGNNNDDDASSMRSYPYQGSEVSTEMSSIAMTAEERRYYHQLRAEAANKGPRNAASSGHGGRRTPGGTATPDSQMWTSMSGAQFGAPPPSHGFQHHNRGGEAHHHSAKESHGRRGADDLSSIGSWSAPSQRVNKMRTHVDPQGTPIGGSGSTPQTRILNHAGENRRGPGGFATHTNGGASQEDVAADSPQHNSDGGRGSGHASSNNSQKKAPHQPNKKQLGGGIKMQAPPPPSSKRQPPASHIPVQPQGGNEYLPPPPPPSGPPPPLPQHGMPPPPPPTGGSKGRGGPSKTHNGIPECKYFKLGCCTKGNSCTFLHVGAPLNKKQMDPSAPTH